MTVSLDQLADQIIELATEAKASDDETLRNASVVLFALAGALHDHPVAVDELARIATEYAKEMIRLYNTRH